MGNSTAAKIIYPLLIQDNYEVVAFSVNHAYLAEKEIFTKPVLPLEILPEQYSPSEYALVNAVGYSNNNQNREFIFNQAKSYGFKFLKYIHPSATVLSDNVKEGVFIMPGVVVEPAATLENNVVIWSNVVIAHHAQVDQHCWIASGSVIAGNAKIGRNTFIGVNATIVNEVSVGEYNIIGAGALITKNTSSNNVFLARSGEKHRFDSQVYSRFYGI